MLCNDERLWKSLYVIKQGTDTKAYDLSWKQAIIRYSELRGRAPATKFLIAGIVVCVVGVCVLNHCIAKEGYYALVVHLLDLPGENYINITQGFHRAAQGGHVHIMQLLLSRGATINWRDSEGWTPLHCAARDMRLKYAASVLAASV